MNRIRFVLLSLGVVAVAAAGFAEEKQPYRLEGRKLVFDSPFDLEIGSTEYAKLIPGRLRSSSTAYYDPESKTATTNWSWSAEARLAQPYCGSSKVRLTFKDEDRHLDSFMIGDYFQRSAKLSVDECRRQLEELAAEVKARHGIELKRSCETTDEEIDSWFKDKKSSSRVSRTFASYSGKSEGKDGLLVGYELSGTVDAKRRCSLSFHAYTSRQPKARRQVVDATRDLVSEAERTKAHAEAEKFRQMLKEKFDVDFDSPKETKDFDFKHEWTKRECPFAGFDEQKHTGSSGFLGIPLSVFALRRAFDGAVSEEELAAIATNALAELQAAYGGPIPEMDAAEAEKKLSETLGDGVPAYGDSRGLLQLDRKWHFFGRIGDIAVEIASAAPQFVRKGDDYEIAVRGAVTIMITQSPIVAYKGEGK